MGNKERAEEGVEVVIVVKVFDRMWVRNILREKEKKEEEDVSLGRLLIPCLILRMQILWFMFSLTNQLKLLLYLY